MAGGAFLAIPKHLVILADAAPDADVHVTCIHVLARRVAPRASARRSTKVASAGPPARRKKIWTGDLGRGKLRKCVHTRHTADQTAIGF